MPQSPITTLLLKYGVTRDSLLWVWSKLCAAAALVVAGFVPLDRYMSDQHQHWAVAVAAIVLFLAGQYNSSPLPGKPKDPPAL